ncbi:hypothetical protein F5Y04DRAFT_247997 [Hypomontagnella monticulosa]|nr:hypothetical protein F5Y04DRAFT_247997 [Hypomontagnella monticulosa]
MAPTFSPPSPEKQRLSPRSGTQYPDYEYLHDYPPHHHRVSECFDQFHEKIKQLQQVTENRETVTRTQFSSVNQACSDLLEASEQLKSSVPLLQAKYLHVFHSLFPNLENAPADSSGDGDNAHCSQSQTKTIKDWRESIEPGLPAPASRTPSIRTLDIRSLGIASAERANIVVLDRNDNDTTEPNTLNPKIDPFEYRLALERFRILCFNGKAGHTTPLWVTELGKLVEANTVDQERKKYVELEYVKKKRETFLEYIDTEDYKENRFKAYIRFCFVLSVEEFFMMMNHYEEKFHPASCHVELCDDQTFPAMHLRSFPSPVFSQVKINHIVGLSRYWITDTERKLGRVFRRPDHRAFGDGSLLFPWLLVVIDDDLQNAKLPLRAGMAMALASGKDWVGYDNAIFGLVATRRGGGRAELFTSWIDISDKENSPRYLFKSMKRYFLMRDDDIKALQGDLMKIHMWGMGERKAKIEAAVKHKMTEELPHETISIQDGLW